MENRNGLIVAAMATTADGHAVRDAALLILHGQQKRRAKRITVGADKAYYASEFVCTARELHVTAHVQRIDKECRSNLDRRTTPHPGYARSLSRRWLIEKIRLAQADRTAAPGQASRAGKLDWIFVFSCESTTY